MSSGDRDSGGGLAILVLGAVALGPVWLLWLAGQLSAVVIGHGWPESSPLDAFGIVPKLVSEPGDPASAWPQPAGALLGPAWLLYAIFGVLLVFLIGALFAGTVLFSEWRRRRGFRWGRLGFASTLEVWRLASRRAVVRRGRVARPALSGAARISPLEVGYHLGRDVRTRLNVYSSVEDAMMVIGAPRQGKDANLVAPLTIDAPGACIVVTTQLETFTSTYPVRARLGNVYVFDPDNLTMWPEKTRLGFVQGCEDPNVADDRAATIAKYSGFFMGDALGSSRNNSVFSASTPVMVVLRCYLHAAALHGRTMTDVVRWARRQADPEPLALLRQAEAAGVGTPGWADELEQFMTVQESDSRAGIWASVSQCLRFLFPQHVLEQFSPEPDEEFDIENFVSGRNTLYILGKERGDNPITPGVHVLLESLVARMVRVASGMPAGRMEPPVTVELNEAPIIAPMGSLPRLMGLCAKRSIAVHLYGRSVSEIRNRFGDAALRSLWDMTAYRIILGGAANHDDLVEMSKLIGEVREPSEIAAIAHNEVLSPVLTVEELRTLQFGNAVVIPRAGRPIEIALTPWWRRKGGKELQVAKTELEQYVQRLAATQRADSRVQDYIRAAVRQRSTRTAAASTDEDTKPLSPVASPGKGIVNPPYVTRRAERLEP